MPKKPHLVEPDSFAVAREIADRFRCGEVVAIDLAGCKRELAMRLLDFSSGICYVTGGELRRTGQGRYLLLPTGRDFDSAEGPDNSPWDLDEDPDRSPLVPGGYRELAKKSKIFSMARSRVPVGRSSSLQALRTG